MQFKEFNIMLDIKRHNKIEYIEVVQGDSLSNILNVSLVDGLEPFVLTGTSVEIVFSKPDGTTVQQTDIVVVNELLGKILCVLKTNTIASPGKVMAEVRILEGETLLTSTRFDFLVRKSLINDETIESTNEFPILTQLINQVEQIEKQVPEEVIIDLEDTKTRIGPLASLLTLVKTSIVNAINSLKTEVNEHKADYAARLNKIEFNCTPEIGYKITNSSCYVVNKIAYLNISVKKIDDTAFATGLYDLIVIPIAPIASVSTLNGSRYSSGGTPGALGTILLAKWNKKINARVIDTESTTININGEYLIV